MTLPDGRGTFRVKGMSENNQAQYEKITTWHIADRGVVR